MKYGRVVALACLLAMLSTPARADEASKTAKIAELLKLQGMVQNIDNMRAESIKRTEALRPLYEKQLRDALPDAPPEMWARFDTAFKRYIDANRAVWSTEDAVAAYGKLYGARLSEDELDQILAFCRSPVGQKDVQASSAAMLEWTAQLAKKNQAAYQANLKAFIDDFSTFVKQCRAAMDAGSKTCDMPAAKKAGA